MLTVDVGSGGRGIVALVVDGRGEVALVAGGGGDGGEVELDTGGGEVELDTGGGADIPPAAKARAVRFHRGLCLSFFEKAVKCESV